VLLLHREERERDAAVIAEHVRDRQQVVGHRGLLLLLVGKTVVVGRSHSGGNDSIDKVVLVVTGAVSTRRGVVVAGAVVKECGGDEVEVGCLRRTGWWRESGSPQG